MAKRFNRSRGGRPFTKGKSTGAISKKSRRTEPIDARKNKYPGSLDDKYKKHVKTTTFEDDVEEDVEEEIEYNEEEDEDEDEDEEEDEEDEDEEEIEPPSEPSVFDNLLKKLEKSSNSRAEGHQKRERQNIKGGDSEEESDNEYSEEEDDFNGSDDNIDENSEKGDAITLSDDESTDVIVDDDLSDAENGLREDNTEGLSSSSQSQSKFGIHITHKLSAEDIEKLSKPNWKYKWNMPAALESSNCLWMGTGDCFQKDIVATAPYGVKLKLYKHWLEVYNNSGGKDFQSSKQRMFFSLCNSYRDILHHHKKPFYQKGSDEDSSTMEAYIIHSLNHVFKTKDVISKNDAKLSKNQETAREVVMTDDSFLDQGFTRPKVLILLPLASVALRFVRRLIQLTPSAHKVNVEYMDRFINDFGADEEDEDNIEAKDLKLKKPSKPSDYQALFGANNNDHFMVGIKFTRKSIRLYSDFYSSDMIVASPLGLITKIGEAEANKEKDVDYLSSIEILVVDHADVISMQNWSHVSTVVEHLNLLPSKQHGGDIMRIRQWYLDAQARFYRQTIILSSYLNPDINSLFSRHCLNFEGKLRLSCEHKGVLPKVILQVRQVYERFDSDSIMEADDARLDYFINKIFPKIKDSVQGGIMLFISSYFEFVRIRNFLKSQNASFCLLSEYTKQSDISRSRNWFIKGQRKIMLYTERAHFYHRYKIRGIQNLIIYSLPDRKEFYPEVLNMLEEGSHNMTCTVLFSRFDQLRLERIVGSAAAKKMTASEKGLFIFK